MKQNIKRAIEDSNVSELTNHIMELEALLRAIDYQTWRGANIRDYTYSIPMELINQIKPLISDTD